ncbi:MAG TPA: hypothetical protein VKY74_06335, partial [Chloroflexia bacterium]|nr:hypothetical protein [Chloroflexia bacterium]
MLHARRVLVTIACLLAGLVLGAVILAGPPAIQVAARAGAPAITCSWWNVVASPNAGTGTNYLTSVAAPASNDVWAVGDYVTASRYQTLTEHWD